MAKRRNTRVSKETLKKKKAKKNAAQQTVQPATEPAPRLHRQGRLK